MTRVRLHIPISGKAGSFGAGSEPDLPDAMAQALVAGGHAELLSPSQETAMTAPAENAMRPAAKPRRTAR